MKAIKLFPDSSVSLRMRLILLLSALITLSSSLLAQSWIWGAGGYGSLKSNDYGSPVATDKDGNAYITGQYADVIIFGSILLTGNSENAYLVKFNSSGEAVWARRATDSGSSSYTFSASVATDKDGNVFIAGQFSGSVTFGSITLRALTPYNNYDNTFLVKYDANGNVIWAKQSVTSLYYYTSSAVAYSVATDKSGNSFITGYLEGNVKFGTFTLQSLYGYSIFLAKYDPNGNVLWAAQSGNSVYTNYYGGYGSSVATDNSGNAYIGGSFYDSITFDSYTLNGSSYSNEPSVFLVKYSPSGNVLWAEQSVNGYINSTGEGISVVCDYGGNPYITGIFENSIKFGAYSLSSPLVSSTFLTKYNATGEVQWTKQSSPGWEGSCLSADEGNNIYLSGGFYSQNPDSLKFGSFALPVHQWATSASFVVEFNSAGKAVCGTVLNNMGYESPRSGIAAGSYGNYVYMAGTFGAISSVGYSDTILCGKDTLLAQGGGANVFIGKWKPCYSVTPPTDTVSIPCGNIFVPDAFSPNNKEGHNVILYVRSSCTNSIDFSVFDRWGNKMFETENINTGWDGNYKNKPVNTGTYLWYLKASLLDGTSLERSGNVALVR